MEKSESEAFEKWWKDWNDDGSFDSDEPVANTAFLAGRASLADTIYNLNIEKGHAYADLWHICVKLGWSKNDVDDGTDYREFAEKNIDRIADTVARLTSEVNSLRDEKDLHLKVIDTVNRILMERNVRNEK
jgi:hypothetical protein